MNATNQTRNGTRHAELLAINALISYTPAALKSKLPPALDDWWLSTEAQPLWDAVDPSKGRTYPYGWKLHPAPIVTPDIIRECTLYVTVEPCVMCASMLRQYRIGRVYFGAVNDKFGGTGGVFRIHKNSTPLPPSLGYYKPPDYVPPRPGTSSSTATKTTVTTPNGTFAVADETQDGDGGNIEPGYPVYGGWGRDEAVSLLRRFYVQENGRAPVPRKKEGRAARLAAMVNANGGGAADADAADTTDSGNAASGVGSPADLTEPTTLSGMLHDKDTKEYMANAPVQESAFAAPSGKENTNLRAL